jgi:hypothetical protein
MYRVNDLADRLDHELRLLGTTSNVRDHEHFRRIGI